MDRFEISPRVQPASQNQVIAYIASLRRPPEPEPDSFRDGVDLARPAIPSANDKLVQSSPVLQAAVEPQASQATPPSAAWDDPDLAGRLLSSLPEEVRKAARQAVKGQMDTTSRPTRSLRLMKNPEGMCQVVTAEPFGGVLESILEDARPLPMDLDDSFLLQAC